LVAAANSRSVPTAVAGATPKSTISNGVIRAPPPTPVTPTMVPTKNPEMTCAKSMAALLASMDAC